MCFSAPNHKFNAKLMRETYALNKLGVIGVLGVHNYERMFCPWNIGNWSFVLDIRLTRKRSLHGLV